MTPSSARYCLAAIAALFAAAISACAAVSTPEALRAPTPGITSEGESDLEGWQPSGVTAIIQSQGGYLWLATYNGLVRFDGVRPVVFDGIETPGLQNSRVTSLYEDGAGDLWIGHETGDLTRLSKGQFQKIDMGNRWPGGPVDAISRDENDDLWLANDAGMLFRVRDGFATNAPGGAGAGRRTALTRAPDGTLWLVANGVVARIVGGRIEPFRFPDAQNTDYYQRISLASDGGLWITGNGRIRNWKGGRWVANFGEYDWAHSPVTAVLETRDHSLLIGTLNQGLYRIVSGLEPIHFNHTNGLSHDWVRALFEDSEGDVWIGTGSGLDKLRARRVDMLDAPDRWQGRAVLSFAVTPSGTAWIGTEGAGLYRYEQGAWSSYAESNGLANPFIWSVLYTSRDQLYVGSWGGGVAVFNGGRFEKPPALAELVAPVVAMFESRDGAIWIGTTVGLYRYADGKLEMAAGKKELSLPDVRAITQLPDGTIWFGMSGGGLGALKDGVLRQFRRKDGLGSDFVQSLEAESDGTLWIGTSDNGMCRMKDGIFAPISESQGLRSKVIGQIVDDGMGDLWLGSNLGIFRAHKSELNRCAERLVNSVHFQRYGRTDGMAVLACTGGFQPGACRTPGGGLWFPTSKGIAVVAPADVGINQVKPPVIIEELTVGGTNFATGGGGGLSAAGAHEPLRIPPGRHMVAVRFTALSFPAPDKVRFKHKLEGLEQEWSEPSASRVAEYSYLPPGPYVFRVMACNNDEIWNENGDMLLFSVTPFFWQTWWFEAGALALGAVGVGSTVLWATRRRVRRKLEQLERQRALERERARIARDIHDDLGASLTRISLLSQTVRGEVESQPQAASDLDQIYHTAREMTRSMDEIVWAVNPRHDTLDSLVTYLGRYAQHFLSVSGVRCRIDVPVHLPAWSLTAEVRHNVFLAFKEALHNVAKHASATEVRISLELAPPGFRLLLADNGRGFRWEQIHDPLQAQGNGDRVSTGNGLLNMRKRLEEIGGSCQWITAPGEGTRVNLSVAVNGSTRE